MGSSLLYLRLTGMSNGPKLVMSGIIQIRKQPHQGTERGTDLTIIAASSTSFTLSTHLLPHLHQHLRIHTLSYLR